MKRTCRCGVVFETTTKSRSCWECRHLGGAPVKPKGLPPLKTWFGWFSPGGPA